MMVSVSSGEKTLSPSESQWHDLFRIFLLSQVVFGHMAAIGLPSIPQLAYDISTNWASILFRLFCRFGSQSAYLFVFLSGFMVAGSLLTSLKNGRLPTAKTYFAKRLDRIAPISVGAILFTALIDGATHLSPSAGDLYRHSYSFDMMETFNWLNFFGNLLFLQPTAVDTFGSNGPLWTLGYIVQYYALGWIICVIYANSKIAGIITLSLLLSAMTFLRPEWAVLFASWLTGGIARHLTIRKRFAPLALCIGSVAFVLSNLAGSLTAAVASIPIGLALTLAARHIPPLWKSCKGNWLREFSKESLTIYAIHHPILMSVFVLIFKGHIEPTHQFFLYVVSSSLAILIAAILFRYLTNAIAPKEHTNRAN